MAIVYRPVSLWEALRVRSREHAQVVAGGTDWMLRRARSLAGDQPVLYVGRVKELQGIVLRGDTLCIGAACTLTDLLLSPLLPDCLKQPLAQMASPAIRNVATIGGNLCNASPAADAMPMLYALDAVLWLQSEGGGEMVPVQDFVLAPGRTGLGEGQLLTQIHVPLQRDWHCTYRKVGMRRANSLSKISFYALADRSPKGPVDVRIAFGAVAPCVVRNRKIEQEILSGAQPLSEDHLQRIITQYDKLLQPIDDARSSRVYRREISLRLLKQYLREEMCK